MALSTQKRKQLLAASLPASKVVREELGEYLQRTGLEIADFARRIGYGHSSLNMFMSGHYHNVAGNDSAIRAAIREFIHSHPVTLQTDSEGKLYETENVRLLEKYFNEALERRRAYYVHGDPGTQKSFVLEHLIAKLNRADVSKNGRGRRAYYVYCRQGMTPRHLMRRIAEAAGSLMLSDIDRVIRNLRFDFGARKVLIVLDEAQHLSIDCLETVRELHDRPPYCGLLIAGSHELDRTFEKNALQLEQWNSRFYAGRPLPGISKEEARTIVRAELGEWLSAPKIEKFIDQCQARHLREGNGSTYISARRLFFAINDAREKLQERHAKGANA